MTVTAMTLRGLRSTEGAVEVLHQLGYAADALPFDATSVGLEGWRSGSGAKPRRRRASECGGHSVRPASLASLGGTQADRHAA
ncbi:hypothetical protein BH24CHL8_BH24CHL8_10500 [soil metagenome]